MNNVFQQAHGKPVQTKEEKLAEEKAAILAEVSKSGDVSRPAVLIPTAE